MAEYAPPPQLGSPTYANLPNMIPAPLNETTKRLALNAFVQGLAGRLAGQMVDKLTTPDLGPQFGLDRTKWYQTPTDPRVVLQYGAQQKGLEETKRHNVAGENVEQGRLGEASRSNKAQEALTQQRLGLEADQMRFEQGPKFNLSQTLGMGQLGLAQQELALKQQLNPAQIAALEAQTRGATASAAQTEAETAAGLPQAKVGGLEAGTAEAQARTGLYGTQSDVQRMEALRTYLMMQNMLNSPMFSKQNIQLDPTMLSRLGAQVKPPPQPVPVQAAPATSQAAPIGDWLNEFLNSPQVSGPTPSWIERHR